MLSKIGFKVFLPPKVIKHYFFIFCHNRLNSLRIRNEARKEIHWEGLNANQLGGTDIHAYWYQRKPLAVHIEATSYALLALIKREEANNPRKHFKNITFLFFVLRRTFRIELATAELKS